jgi:hypothetical protein
MVSPGKPYTITFALPSVPFVPSIPLVPLAPFGPSGPSQETVISPKRRITAIKFRVFIIIFV